MTDLTLAEQANVRVVLDALRKRTRGWKPLAKVLHFEPRTLRSMYCDRSVTASMAFRVARLVGCSIDDLLAGKYPGPP